MVTILENVSNRTLLWVNIALKFLDIGLTAYIVTTWGLLAESNTFIRNTIETYGLIPTMAGITLAHIGLIWLLYKKNRRKLLFIAAGLMTMLVIMNGFATVIQ